MDFVCKSMYVGTDRPVLKYLNRHVIHKITGVWYNIGVELLDPGDEAVLDTIKINYPENAVQCTTEMIKLWLDRKVEANWGQLLEAFRENKLNTFAKEIEEMLSKGMCIYTI